MTNMMIFLAALFLPLFPMSMVFNAIMANIAHPIIRIALFIVWPQIGLWLLTLTNEPIPDWVLIWGAATAIFYGFRLTVIRENGVWATFLATSSWALLWLFTSIELQEQAIYIALAMSLPLVILTLLSFALVRRYGAAYTGLFSGLALTMPRYSGILVLTVLAATATPAFPGFFIMIKASTLSAPLLMVMIGLTWLLWSWSAARFIQGMIVGAQADYEKTDISLGATWLYALSLILLAIAGSVVMGGLL